MIMRIGIHSRNAIMNAEFKTNLVKFHSVFKCKIDWVKVPTASATKTSQLKIGFAKVYSALKCMTGWVKFHRGIRNETMRNKAKASMV
jgi:asparagine synthetase A